MQRAQVPLPPAFASPILDISVDSAFTASHFSVKVRYLELLYIVRFNMDTLGAIIEGEPILSPCIIIINYIIIVISCSSHRLAKNWEVAIPCNFTIEL